MAISILSDFDISLLLSTEIVGDNVVLTLVPFSLNSECDYYETACGNPLRHALSDML